MSGRARQGLAAQGSREESELEQLRRLDGAAGAGARDRQEGGSHYIDNGLSVRSMANIARTGRIEPWDVWEAFALDPWTANAVKYLLRWRKKNGAEDLRKAKHYIEELLEQEGMR